MVVCGEQIKGESRTHVEKCGRNRDQRLNLGVKLARCHSKACLTKNEKGAESKRGIYKKGIWEPEPGKCLEGNGHIGWEIF